MPIQHAKKINFAFLNKRSVAVLCATSSPQLKEFEKSLKANGYSIWTGTNSSELYTHLGTEAVGFVILGMDLGIEKLNQISGFLIRKFKCPILFFNREKLPLPIEALKSPPETVVFENLDLKHLEEELRLFEFKYENRLREIYNVPLILEEDFFGVAKGLPIPAASNVLQSMTEVIKEDPRATPLKEGQEYQLYKLSCPSENGYFIFAFPNESAPGRVAQAIAVLNQHLLKANPETHSLEPLDQKFQLEVYQSLTAQSEKTIVGFVEDQEMILSYFNLPNGSLADSEFEEIGDRTMIGIEDWWTEIPLNFNAYLWLEKNNHKFIYVKKGDRLRTESLQKFKNRGYKKMAIQSNEVAAYRKLRELFHASRRKTG